LEDRIIQKYVKDLSGLLNEIRTSEAKSPLRETEVDELMYENSVIFAFGRLFKYFNFSEIHFGTPKNALDAVAVLNGQAITIEFEPTSIGFLEHLKKNALTPQQYKTTLIVCWKHDSNKIPSEIDVLELKKLWELAKATTTK
jgi:hypothetical protein